MNTIRLKRHDQVVAITGRDRGKKGKILKIFPDSNRAIVEGVNLVTKHQRATRDNPKGGIIRRESSIHISNLQLVCSRCGKPARVGFSILADQTKKRMCRRCKEILE